MTTQAEMSPEEVARRGEEIYQRMLRPHVEQQHFGEFLVVDVLSGDYEIDRDDLAASDRLLARNPHAVLYGVRIGYPAAYHIGGRTLVKPS
jgi:hypothetical protein